MAGDDIFVYLGGDQEVPMDVKHVVIDRSVKIIPLSFDVQTLATESIRTLQTTTLKTAIFVPILVPIFG